MPYIEQDRRRVLDSCVLDVSRNVESYGEINYVITQILLAEVPDSYQAYNDLIGVLECVKLEFYRRAVAAYEDKKIAENGDVY